MDKEIDVHFTVAPQYQNLGRNRYTKARGIQISLDETHKEVHFFGIGTKGTPTAGIRLVVPLADLAQVRDALNLVLAHPAPDVEISAMEAELGQLPDAVAAAWSDHL